MVDIQNYRGFVIQFDEQNETFKTDLDNGWREKKSFAAIKKSIDDFIKENSEFKPFKVVNKDGEFADIVGVRKDGFIHINSKKENSKFSEYYESDYFLYEPEKHDVILAEIASIQADIETLRLKIVPLVKQIDNGNSLKELRKKYIV